MINQKAIKYVKISILLQLDFVETNRTKQNVNSFQHNESLTKNSIMNKIKIVLIK